MNRRTTAALLAAAALAAGGCVPLEYDEQDEFLIFLNIITGGGLYQKGTRFESSLTVDVAATAGGEDGTYSITLDNPGGGTFGTFSGTATVKRGRFVTVKTKNTPELLAAVEALVEASIGYDVTITKAKSTFKAFQQPGGVEATTKTKITFSGTVTATGDKVKGGKILADETFVPNS